MPVTLTGVGSVPGTEVRLADPDQRSVARPAARTGIARAGPWGRHDRADVGSAFGRQRRFLRHHDGDGVGVECGVQEMRRARSLLGEDLDAVESSWSGHTGFAKQQLAGPYTLAATVERKGNRLVSDRGLMRDLLTAYRQLIADHRAQLGRRVGATWLIQLDEPSLPAVAAGMVRTTSGMSVLPALEPDLDLGADLLHCCAGGFRGSGCDPWAGF